MEKQKEVKKRKKRNELYNAPLTDNQRKLVEDNYKLIQGYARWRNINLSDYHGLLAIGLCNAAKLYNPEKGSFSSIAYYCMDNEFGHYNTKTKTQKRNNGESDWSYNNIDKKSEEEYINILTDKTFDTLWIEMELKDTLEKFIQLFPKQRYREIIQLRCLGYNLDEIAIMYGYKDRRNIDYYMKEIRKKWREYRSKDSK